MTDFYLEHPEALNGQPKRTIADYVASNNFLVCTRFDNLEEGKRFDVNPFFRSEHPQEYDGVSGLLNSFSLRSNIFGDYQEVASLGDVKDRYFNYLINKKSGNPQFIQFCELTETDKQEFIDDTSFSIWENLAGVNRTIIADSSIPYRWHIMSYREGDKDKPGVNNYTIFDLGKEPKQYLYHLSSELKKDLMNLIEIYEGIRHLNRFDPNHCPIMEFQTADKDNKNYFLQYHRCRDFDKSTFSLDRPLKKGEVEVPFVRGHTLTEEGEVCKITLDYAGYLPKNWNLQGENGSFDFEFSRVFKELQYRHRKLQIYSNDLGKAISAITSEHAPRSRLFKPKISVIQKIDPFLNGQTTWEILNNMNDTDNAFFMMKIISDGKRGYLSRID